ncbi:tail fiber domain-containing protein [Flavobacterium sp. UW10123]|uniref:tail fiber domain-containing protein n=1 Tax=Flavobacterium sp. UW10123 TaxID=3230800 RepID=UPI00339B35EE
MKNKILPLLFVLGGYSAYSQVVIGKQEANPSAQLEVFAKDRGILIPQIPLKGSTDQTTIKSGNVNSLLVFNTATIADIKPGYYYWYIDRWRRIALSDEAGSGKEGKGISNTDITPAGNLIVTLTDGTKIDAGKVKGDQGLQGIPGTNGKNGLDGKGIAGTSVDASGNLIITYTDGTTSSAGTVKGADGANGKNGLDGKGISGTSVDASGNLIITYTDGTTSSAGAVKGADGANGKNGLDGKGISGTSVDASGNLIITYTDGTTLSAGTVKGADGAKGEKGDQGIQGVAGANGADGAKGDQGEKGEKGDQGIQGVAGANGADGAKGDQGEKGEKGDQGIQGIAGANGADGAKGDQGEKGEKGDQGIQGVAGANGADGAKGDQGEKGEKGDQGIQGVAGANGADGAKGDQGEKGEKGDQGIQGVAGANGADGAKGDQGEKGEKGDQGIQGVAGANGADGAKGDQGEKGEKGDQGEKGEKGDQGIQGIAGSDATVTKANLKTTSPITISGAGKIVDSDLTIGIDSKNLTTTTSSAVLQVVNGNGAVLTDAQVNIVPAVNKLAMLITDKPGTVKWSDDYPWLLGGNDINNGLDAIKNLGTKTNFDLPFITNNTEWMRLTTAGRLGLGIITPQAGIHLKSSNALTNDVIFEGIGDNSAMQLYFTPATAGTLAKGQKLGQFTIGYTNSGGSYVKGSSIMSNYKGTDNGTTNATDLQFWTSNSIRATIDENGSLGVGTTAPDPASIVDIVNGAKGVSFPQVSLASTTTKPASGNTPKDGTVVYNANASITGTGANGKGMYYWDGGASGNWNFMKNLKDDTIDWHVGGNNNGALKTIGTNDNFDLPFVTNNKEWMRLTNAGKLGLGTDTPGSGLHVVSEDKDDSFDDVRISTINGNNNPLATPAFILARAKGTAAVQQNLAAGDAIGSIIFQPRYNGTYSSLSAIGAIYKGNGTSPLSNLTFSTSQGVKMTLDENGYLGIGTTTPSVGLHVKSSTGSGNDVIFEGVNRSSTFSMNYTTSNATLASNTMLGKMNFGYALNGSSTFVNASSIMSSYLGNGTSNSSDLQFFTSGAIRVTIDKDGSFIPSGNGAQTLGGATNRWGTIYSANGTIQTSDIRLKKNIEPLKYGLEDVMKIDPISYTWKDDASNKMKVGVSAQQVQKVLPEVVDVANDEANTLGVNYAEMVPVLINAIKEQQTQIKEKDTKILNLENRMEKLEQLVNELSKK